MAGSVLIGEVMPSLRAVSATLSRPTWSASLAATVLTERCSASARVIWPRYSGSKLCGVQPSMVTGSSVSIVWGVRPFSRAVR